MLSRPNAASPARLGERHTLDVAEQRDVKGLYAKARAGLIPNFTGIDSPYETPENAELILDTVANSAADLAERVVDYLKGEG